jgi:hypothetical protein
MQQIVMWVLKHCTCYSWGWMTTHFNENVFNTARFNTYCITNLVIISFILFLNIIYFIIKAKECYSKIYIPLALLYLVINFIFLCLAILFFTIFGLYTWFGFGTLFIVFSMMIICEESGDHIDTWLDILPSFMEYSKSYKEYHKAISQYKLKYNTYLNGKNN